MKYNVIWMTQLDWVLDLNQWVLNVYMGLKWWREHWIFSIKQCETVSRKQWINRESKTRRSQFIYTVIVVTQRRIY